MGLTPSTADALFARRRRRDHERQPHLGQARDLPVPRGERPRPAAAQLRHARRARPRLGRSTTRSTARSVAVINLQGRTYMQPIENPFTDADPLLDEVVRAAAAGPARRLPLRADVREERARAPPRRAGQRGRRDAHPRRDRRRADPARRHRLPDRPRDDRPGLERHRLRPGDRPAAVHQRPADPVRGRRRAGGLQRRPDRHRPGDRAGRSRSSASSALVEV